MDVGIKVFVVMHVSQILRITFFFLHISLYLFIHLRQVYPGEKKFG
jgi:hypothetical protein